MIHQIEVKGIECYSYHGCLPQEAQIGGKYIVDVVITCDFTLALNSDDLKDTICYTDIYQIVMQEMKIRSKLIEHVAGRIFMRLKNELKNTEKIQVKITKVNPPINGAVNNCAVSIGE